MSRYLFHLTSQEGRQFGIRRQDDDASGGLVVDDLDAGTELGHADATCQPILVDVGGQQQVLFAGTPDVPEQSFTAVDGHRYPVRYGVWMSFPEPFIPGMVVTIAGLDADANELFSVRSRPLGAGRLDPLFGPGWTGYAPLGEE